MDELMAWLPAHIPADARDESRVSIVHGDYRLDNLMFHATEPRVIAVLDWELSTLGHPLADFSYHCMAWHIPPGSFRGIGGSGRCQPGHPHRRRVHPPVLRTHRPHHPAALKADWNFYMAYNLFRLAAILQGIAKRVEAGTASSAQAASSARARAAWPRWPGSSHARPDPPIPTENHMDFDYSPKTKDLQARLLKFMDDHIYPEREGLQGRAGSQHRGRQALERPADHREPQAQGPGRRPVEPVPAGGQRAGIGLCRRRPDQPGIRPAGRNHGPGDLGSEVFNCSAPDTGNMETIARYGDEANKARWLKPLLEGKIRSAFAMTEPEVASSDATNIATRIERQGDEYVINGHKWWISGAADPRCAVYITMGKTDPEAPRIRSKAWCWCPRTPRAYASCARSTSWATTTRRTAMWRCTLRTCACRSATSCWAKAAASRSPRAAWARAASTTACA
jgi:hypothetical protein